MSKYVLDISQMQHLKELGLDTSNASMALIYTNSNGDVVDWENVNVDVHESSVGEYNPYLRRLYGAFTLQDILDLLPKEMRDKDDDKFVLKIEYGILHRVWHIGYYYYDVAFNDNGSCSRENLVDAAYEILCWCIENEYIKTNLED